MPSLSWKSFSQDKMTSGCSFDSYYTTVAYTTPYPSLQDICSSHNDTNHCQSGFNEQPQN